MSDAGTLHRPGALLFDWDNTLVDTWTVIHRALNDMFSAMGRPTWSLEETKSRVRGSARDTFPEMFGARWKEAEERFYAAFRAVHLDHLQACAGAERMLRDLAGRGLFLGIVSNKRGDILRDEVRHLGWSALFGRVVGATDAAKDKPAVEAVQCALEGSGHAAGPAVWFVGDTDIDMECAVAAGLTPILLRAERPRTNEFAPEAPVHHVQDCVALIDLVDSA